MPIFRDEDPTSSSSTSRPVSLSSSMKFEVFRDEDAELPPTDLGASTSNRDGSALSLASKSIRGPPEAELLRADPFRHYQKDTIVFAEIPDLPFGNQESKVSTSSSSSSNRNGRTVSNSSKSASSATSSKLAPLSSQASTSVAKLAPGEKRKERVASPLHLIYPEGATGPEYSFEELQAAKRHLRKLKTGQFGSQSTWNTEEEWQTEARKLHTPWRVDKDGKAILRDEHSGEALFDYLKECDAIEQEAKLVAKRKKQAEEAEARARQEAEEKERRVQQRLREEEEEERMRQEAERKAREEAEAKATEEAERRRRAEDRRRQAEEIERLQAEEEARRMAEQEQQMKVERLRLEREEEAEAYRLEQERLQQAAQAEAEARRLAEAEADMQNMFEDEDDHSESPHGSASYRPSSPTINTKAALAEVNAMFGKTMRFDSDDLENHDDYDSSATEQSGSSENDFGAEVEQDEVEQPFVPSQAETDGSFWSIAQSQSQQPQPFSQPFSTQQSQPFSSQSSSLGFPSASESGETTEESDTESDLVVSRNSEYLDLPRHQQQLHQSLSRSSSSSSSAASIEQPVSFQASLRAHVPAFTPFKESVESDENAGSAHSTERNAFKPTRTPLGAKPLGPSSALTSKPAFAVFSEEGEQAPSAAQAEQIYRDENEDAAGYGMGRRPAGNNRFATMMDIMTPITERTCEFGMQTATMTSTAGGDVQARMLTDRQLDVEDLFDEQPMHEDLASSRGSNWDAGRRLEQIEEEADYSSQSEGAQGMLTSLPESACANTLYVYRAIEHFDSGTFKRHRP